MNGMNKKVKLLLQYSIPPLNIFTLSLLPATEVPIYLGSGNEDTFEESGELWVDSVYKYK